MWLLLAFISATLLGFYDVAKKQAVKQNSATTVLLLNTLFSSIIFLPVILSAELNLGLFDGTIFATRSEGFEAHILIIIKSAIVLGSWIFGYIGIKHLPLTIVGPINATPPVLSRAGKREGIDFAHNRWILCIAAAAILGAISGLYDRYIMRELQPLFVQSWYNLYQLAMMSITVAIIHIVQGKNATPFRWSWAIPMISILLSAADLAYFVALSNDDAMISIVSMIRRGSVVVSFTCGALLLREKNLRAKAIDLIFILVGMIFLWLGSR